MSRSLDCLAWLGLARLASAWLVSSGAATRTATTPEQAYKTIGAALRAAAMVVDAIPRGRPWPGPGGPSRVHNVGSGSNHRKWFEMGRESTLWLETWSK